MISLYVNNNPVDLPIDISIDFHSENPFFSSAEGYSFDFSIPLKDSTNNSSLFGNLFLPEVDIDTVRFPALLISDDLQLSGILVIVSLDQDELAVQFLEGRSARNFESTIDELYINEMSLGDSKLPKSIHSTSVTEALSEYGQMVKGIQADAIALPWVIKDSAETVHNQVLKNGLDLQWYFNIYPDRNASYSIGWMPYLLTIAKRIASEAGFSFDFSKWEDSPFKGLFIANVLPTSLRIVNWALALPHWTFSEFWKNIEPILLGEFSIDYRSRHIHFDFTSDIIDQCPIIQVEKMFDDFSSEIEDPSENEDSNLDCLNNIGYEDNSYRFWNMESCDWFIRKRLNTAVNQQLIQDSRADSGEDDNYNYHRPPTDWKPDPMAGALGRSMEVFESMLDMIDSLKKFHFWTVPGDKLNWLFFCREVSCYFAFRVIAHQEFSGSFEWPFNTSDAKSAGLREGTKYFVCELMPVNQFGDIIHIDKDDAARQDLKCVPVAVDSLFDRKALFLPYCGDDGQELEAFKDDPNDPDSTPQPYAWRELELGDRTQHEYYSKLYIGFWNGIESYHYKQGLIPITSNFDIFPDFSYEIHQGKNLRLNFGRNDPYMKKGLYNFDRFKQYKFSFFVDSLPSPRSIYVIRGKRYICAKLSTKITHNNHRLQISGEFYRLL
ncbi:MAG: hypothetical protein K2M59_09895 [Muribaculaceae bacterium]|nr:hypothetical protein [Muribaculaceae bacterium]